MKTIRELTLYQMRMVLASDKELGGVVKGLTQAEMLDLQATKGTDSAPNPAAHRTWRTNHT